MFIIKRMITSKGVWLVMFGAEPDYYNANYDIICKYAKSVRSDT